MDKGIRPFCNAFFAEKLPTRINTRAGNTAFRKTVMCEIMEQFDITLASASTHYNHSFQCGPIPLGQYVQAEFRGRKFKMGPGLGIDPELFVGLGREADKKGGPKPKAKVVAVAPAPISAEGEATFEVYALQDVYALQGEQALQAAAAAGLVMTPEEELVEPAEVVAVVQEVLYNVYEKRNGNFRVGGLTEQAAREMLTAADRGKKAKLVMTPV
jgi:hypothetical protein